MKYLPLIWTALWRRPARTIFTFLSIAAAFVLFGTMTGLSEGFARTIDQTRQDRLLVLSRFGGPIPIAYLDQIQNVAGVTVAAPLSVLFGTYQDPMNFIVVMMSDDRTSRLRPEFPVTPEQYAALAGMRTGAIVSTHLAERHDWNVGDRVPIQSPIAQQDGAPAWNFDIVAVVPDPPLWTQGFMLGNYAYLDEARADGKGTADQFFLLIRDPDQAASTSSAIDALFANSAIPTRTISERFAAENGLRSIVDIQRLTIAVVGAAMFMLLFLTVNVIAQSVRERIPEFAVLKTIGFSDPGLLMLVLSEALVLCLSGAVLGLAISRGAAPSMAALLPPGMGLPLPDLSPTVLTMSVVAAIAVALVSCVPSAWRVTRLNVVDALSRSVN